MLRMVIRREEGSEEGGQRRRSSEAALTEAFPIGFHAEPFPQSYLNNAGTGCHCQLSSWEVLVWSTGITTHPAPREMQGAQPGVQDLGVRAAE